MMKFSYPVYFEDETDESGEFLRCTNVMIMNNGVTRKVELYSELITIRRG